MGTIIFRKTIALIGYKKLLDSNKLWLLRESVTHDEMISMDMFDPHAKRYSSYRFAHDSHDGWVIAHDHHMFEFSKRVTPTLLLIERLVEKIKNTFELHLDDLLIPIESESSTKYM